MDDLPTDREPSPPATASETNEVRRISISQFSISYMLILVALAGMFSVGLRTNWNDYLGMAWLVVLSTLVYSSLRQVYWLIKKRNLPFDADKTATRWVWIICRSVGAILLMAVIFNPYHLIDFEGPDWYGGGRNRPLSDNWFISATILYEAGRSLVVIGILFCILPLWRYQRVGWPPAIRWCMSGLGATVALAFAAACLAVSVFGSQVLSALFLLAVSGIDLALPTRFAGTEMFETEFDWNLARVQFSEYCSWLAGFSGVCLVAFGCFVRIRGSKRYVCLAVWSIGVLGAARILFWIYSDGAASLTLSWNEVVGYPSNAALACIACILVMAGLLVAILVNRSGTSNVFRLDLSRLIAFAPRPIVSVAILVLVAGHIAHFGMLFSNRSGSGPLARLYSSNNAGPIHGSFSTMFEDDFSLVWGILLGLIATSHLNLNYWNKRKTVRFEAVASSVPLGQLMVNGVVASMTLVVSAIGFGWFGFSLYISKSNTRMMDGVAWLNAFCELHWDLIQWYGTAAAVIAACIILLQLIWRKKSETCCKWRRK